MSETFEDTLGSEANFSLEVEDTFEQLAEVGKEAEDITKGSER